MVKVLKVGLDGGVTEVDEELPNLSPDLDTIKATLSAQVDMEAEASRLKYITGGAGQALTYQNKAEEAAAILSGGDPDPADYPLLAAEVGITAPTLTEVAQIVNLAQQQWKMVGAQIEALRLGAKVAIAAAETIEEAEAAANINWP